MSDQGVKERISSHLEDVAFAIISFLANPPRAFRMLALAALMPLSSSLGWLSKEWNDATSLPAVLSVIAALVNVMLLWLVARSLEQRNWCRRIQYLQTAFAYHLLFELFALALLGIAIDLRVGRAMDAIWGIFLQAWNVAFSVSALKLLGLLQRFELNE